MIFSLSSIISYLSASFPYAAEYQSSLMALQGAMTVRNGLNKNGKMPWFHAFCQGVVLGYAGALFTPLWMGNPTPMLSNDMNIAMCILSFLFVNYIPFGIGRKICNFLPVKILVVSGAQLFRSMGIAKFITIAHDAFKHNPSEYYPHTPVFGPILLATILGNMGAFFAKGFHGHLKDGMPYPFQNGLFCASFYHFLVNDQEGPIGNFLRSLLETHPILTLGIKDYALFGKVFIGAFMQIVGILQMPEFLGPSFSPFHILSSGRTYKIKVTQANVSKNDTIRTEKNNNNSNNGKSRKQHKKKKN
mmetsp:Transcript_15752/g.22399  ORF Transcript_15752/g.22399 Transcript_15752/m.22399 type:complete len:303 (-) Transcript_15752:180-1088(-)